MYDKDSLLISDAVARILSSFASREDATVEDVVTLAQQLPQALGEVNQNLVWSPEIWANERIKTGQPAVAIDQSVSDDAVTCLCCGRALTMLKRHLKAEHGLSEHQYRAQFNLNEDHPLVAPNYSLRKAEYAKKIGLGKYARNDSAAQGAGPSV